MLKYLVMGQYDQFGGQECSCRDSRSKGCQWISVLQRAVGQCSQKSDRLQAESISEKNLNLFKMLTHLDV